MKKQGISLIVLVITIIVLAILAAAVILSLNDTGVVDSAQKAVLTDAYSKLGDILSTKYADLKVEAHLGDDAPGVVADADAATAYDAAFGEAGFNSTSPLSADNKTNVTYTKKSGKYTMTVTFNLSTDGAYTVSSSVTE